MAEHLDKNDHLQLEAYRSLQQENSGEARDAMSLDAIFLVITGASLFGKTPALLPLSKIFLGVGYVMIMVLWLGLTRRQHKRIVERIKIMKGIESSVGFSAYQAMESHIGKEPSILKFPYYRMLLALVIVAILIVEICKGLC